MQGLTMIAENSILALVLLGVAAVAGQFALRFVKYRLNVRLQGKQVFGPLLNKILGWGYGFASVVLWIAAVIAALEILPSTMPGSAVEHGLAFARRTREILFEPITLIGNSRISIFTLLAAVVFVVIVSMIAKASRRILLNRVLSRTSLDVGVRQAVATFTQYLVIVVGILIGLQTAGINLSALTFLAGAVGVGVGFGLQNIANNFISGLIILLERPIKIGDRIEVGDVTGDVVHIAARSTTVLTNDNIAIIIPNSSFISSNVINWSHVDPKVRFRVPVSVAYGSDVRFVERLLLQVAKENENVLEDPPPRVIFKGFGDSALEFELRVWTMRLLHRRGVLLSQLNFSIYEKFQRNDVQIPFPQRDVHIKMETMVQKTPTQTNDIPAAEPDQRPD